MYLQQTWNFVNQNSSFLCTFEIQMSPSASIIPIIILQGDATIVSKHNTSPVFLRNLKY